ncbi:MAG: aminotransferase [Bacteroidetes bacterium]|nr:aminotransferase [Bacteroidota bacterium]
MLKKILIKFLQHNFFENLFRSYWFFKLNKKKNYFINREKKPRLFWGPIPLINNKYWSNALKSIGYASNTVMLEYYSIHKKEDFDLYFDEIFSSFRSILVPNFIGKLYYKYQLFEYLLFNYDIFTFPFSGLIFKGNLLRKFELPILKLLNKKIVIIPYGGDAYMYSKIKSTSLQQALLFSYPELAKREKEIEENVFFWQQNADAIVVDFMIDGMSRWDVLPCNILVVDHHLWKGKDFYNKSDGINGVVTIVHSPNHRGFKGSEFVIDAINELKNEGLKINFILLEKVKNEEVRRVLFEEADILVEQLILGYALNAIEGMASGVPVLSNLSNEEYVRIFRRYSYLNECPILTTTPENIKENLKILIQNPELREQLGRASKKYAEKYHSNETAVFMFENIYDKIWHNKNVDLLNLFHPLKQNSYNNKYPKIKHPLIENKIPSELLSKLNK